MRALQKRQFARSLGTHSSASACGHEFMMRAEGRRACRFKGCGSCRR